MPANLQSLMAKPMSLADIAKAGFDPSVSPSLGLLMAAAASASPQAPARRGSGFPPPRLTASAAAPLDAPTSPVSGGNATVPNSGMASPDGQAAARTAPATLGDLAPVNFGVDRLPSVGGPSLADLANGLPSAGKLHDGPNWGKILGTLAWIVGDGLAGAAGRPALFTQSLIQKRQDEREQNNALERIRTEVEMRRQAALAPHLEQVGNTIGMLDGNTRSFEPLYTSPSPAEQYAGALGYQPGSDEYKQSVQDYLLKGYSDAAMPNRLGLIDHRYDRSDAQLGERLAVTRRGQDLTHGDRRASIAQSNTNNVRSTSTSAANNVRSTTTSANNNAATNEMRFQTSRKPRGGPVEVSTPEEARKLPPGTFFKTPDGRILQR